MGPVELRRRGPHARHLLVAALRGRRHALRHDPGPAERHLRRRPHRQQRTTSAIACACRSASQTIDGTTYAYSPLTEIVIKHPPVNTVAPSFTGTARVGQDLHGQWGQWSYDGSRMRVTYSWQRCQADGTRCVTIPGQPNDIFAADHTIKRADAGHRLRLQIGIQTPDGDVYAYAPLTDVVTA